MERLHFRMCLLGPSWVQPVPAELSHCGLGSHHYAWLAPTAGPDVDSCLWKVMELLVPTLPSLKVLAPTLASW